MSLNKDTKNDIEFYASVFALFVGLVLLFIGVFIRPQGEIHYSVLTAFGEISTFVGCVWGIKYKYQNK